MNLMGKVSEDHLLYLNPKNDNCYVVHIDRNTGMERHIVAIDSSLSVWHEGNIVGHIRTKSKNNGFDLPTPGRKSFAPDLELLQWETRWVKPGLPDVAYTPQTGYRDLYKHECKTAAALIDYIVDQSKAALEANRTCPPQVDPWLTDAQRASIVEGHKMRIERGALMDPITGVAHAVEV